MKQQKLAVTVDCALFFKSEKGIKILLIRRKNEPFRGEWALPGGFLDDKEPLETAAKRELQEETGLEIASLHQIKAFGAPNRDPRQRIISIAFFGEVFSEEKVKGADDAAEARWFETTKLPPLAFDHQEIVELALVKFYSRKKE